MKRFWLTAALAGTLSIGCTEGQIDSEAETDLDTTEGFVEGGTPTDGDPAVVAILGAAPGVEGQTLCTASVIAPDVLLTAAHCVHPRLVPPGAEFTAFTGPDLTNDETRGTAYPVARTVFNEAFSPINATAGNDIALVFLAQPIEGIEPLKYRTTNFDLPRRSQVRLVGYGLENGRTQEGAGIKREAQVPVAGLDNLFVRTGSWFNRTGICNGDSGGPVLAEIDGEVTIVGVNSFGFRGCIGPSSSTRVDTYADWLAENMR